jgi:hypothetical protein
VARNKLKQILVSMAFAGAAGNLAGLGTYASWIGSTSATGSISTGTLAAPTNPATAAGTCSPFVGDRTVVSWTPTSSTWAGGYEVLRSTTSGGTYSVLATVTGQGAMSYTDGPLPFSTTYYYVVRATKSNWRSAQTAQVQRTTKSGACI